MRTVNIHAFKTHLSKLVERAAQGEPFIIAKAGNPMVKAVPLKAEKKKAPQRLGFMKGETAVPDDFDTMFAHEIRRMFYGESDAQAGLGHMQSPARPARKRDARRTVSGAITAGTGSRAGTRARQ